MTKNTGAIPRDTSAEAETKPLVLAITGVTAGGKTELSLRLASLLDAEIVICDSMQIYRCLDIGTAKPSLAEQARAPHHLLDIRDVWEHYSVADYVLDARKTIADILRRGKTPILVGGSLQYLNSLVRNICYPSYGDPAKIRDVEAELAALDAEEQYRKLRQVDPEAASAIHPHNHKRVRQSLKQYLCSGGVTKAERERLSRVESAPYRYAVYAVQRERGELRTRIRERVRRMLDQGLLDECRWLYQQVLPADATARFAIGYKEFFPYLKGEQSLQEATETLILRSAQYAKRQETWLRSLDYVQFLAPAEPESLCAHILDASGAK